jgi:hypothetical protein
MSASKNKEITGIAARIIGLFCFLLGLAGAAALVLTLARQ